MLHNGEKENNRRTRRHCPQRSKRKRGRETLRTIILYCATLCSSARRNSAKYVNATVSSSTTGDRHYLPSAAAATVSASTLSCYRAQLNNYLVCNDNEADNTLLSYLRRPRRLPRTKIYYR